MARLVFRDRGIIGRTEAPIPILCVRARIPWITVIGIDRMTGGTAARTVIAWMIVRTQERQMRIIQACLMDVQNRHADTQPGPQPADTLSDVRLPPSVIGLWVPNVWE